MHSFQDIDSALNYINQLMLSYSLYDSGNTTQISQDDAKIRENLEDKLQAESQNIFTTENNTTTLSLDSIWTFLETIQEDIENSRILDYRMARLKGLKDEVIHYQQEYLLQRVKSFIDPLASLCRSMSAETEAEKAFPLIYDPSTRETRAINLKNFQQLMKEGGPDEIVLYFDEINRLVFRGDDIRGGSEMLQSLEEQMFFWSLTPSTLESSHSKDSERTKIFKEKLEDKFGPQKYGYAKLALELDDMKSRLSNIKFGWRSLLVQVFKNDYGENMERDEKRLMELGDEIGSSKLLERIENQEVMIPNILKQISVLGPTHLDMVLDHIDIYLHKIETEVFGHDSDIPSHPKRQRYLVITEPKQFVVMDDNIMKSYGLLPDEIAIFGKEAYGLLSTYTVLTWPPERYDGQIPKKAKKYAGNIYKGDRFTVIDVYADMLDAPEALVEAYLENKDLTSPEFREIIESARLPRGSYQVRVPSDLLLRPDLSVIAEGRRMQNIDGTIRPVYEIELPRRDLGAHDRIKQLVAENTQSSMMSRQEFEKRIISGQLF